uniref:Innexin n=3 Tax=Ciona intestinalis TaxID=7719 RepID=F6V1S5_CIOIN
MPQETVTENLQANLERASQLHENELVIELGIDRFLKWLGVYTILLIALVAKISEFIGQSTSCYPAYNTSGYDRKFIEYATSFCWESVTTSDITTPEGCLVEGVKSNMKLLPNPKAAIYFIRWLPQVMLVQAFLFAVPSICWHFVVGGRLAGHVRFIQLLLNDMYEAFRKLPTADYENKPYDESSECFN